MNIIATMLCIAAAGITTLTVCQAGESPVRPVDLANLGEGARTDEWRGFQRHLFKVDGANCWVVEPKQPAPGNPWMWCMEFPDAFADRTGALAVLGRGFYYVHIEVGNTFGCPKACVKFDGFYKFLSTHGFAKRGVLLGISRGGLYAYNWAATNTDKVAGICGDAPVCDFKSWPGGKGRGKGSQPDWESLIRCYEFSNEAEALKYAKNPVDNLAPLAKARIPLIHVVGDADDVVPVDENTALIESRYRALGGTITVHHKPGIGHHPHGLEDPSPVADFAEACVGLRPATAPRK